jgi:hypothetical protein
LYSSVIGVERVTRHPCVVDGHEDERTRGKADCSGASGCSRLNMDDLPDSASWRRWPPDGSIRAGDSLGVGQGQDGQVERIDGYGTSDRGRALAESVRRAARRRSGVLEQASLDVIGNSRSPASTLKANSSNRGPCRPWARTARSANPAWSA